MEGVSARGSTRTFCGSCGKGDQGSEVVQAKLFEEVGRLKMELDWIKKLPGPVDVKRQWLVPGHPQLSIRRQCELMNLGRANWDYHPIEETADTLELVRHIDQQNTRTPFYDRGGPHSLDRNIRMISEIFCVIFLATKGAEDGTTIPTDVAQ